MSVIINNYMSGDYHLISEAYKKVIKEQTDNNFLKFIETYFEDLLNVTDQRELIEKIRSRIEIPEIKNQLGPAMSGNIVEMVFRGIREEQQRRSNLVADENSEESPTHVNKMSSIADEIERIASNMARGQMDEDNIQQLFGIAEEIRKEYR